MLTGAARSVLIPLSLVLAACQPTAAPAEPALPDASPSTTAAPAPGPAPAGTGTPASSGTDAMDKTCEGVTFRIVRKQSSGDSGRTSLQIVGPDGQARDVRDPEEMAEYTAVGLGCAVAASDRKPYFIVQYGDLPYGCEFCEWFYVYDSTGKQLTSSKPPLLTDASLPEGEQQTPNTREYEAMIRKLGIAHPEVEYIQ